MSTIELMYEREAQEYGRSLPLEHFAESIPQSTQRYFAWTSLDLVKARRSDMHVFNELLVQYPVRGEAKPAKVVPDNMVVISREPLRAKSNFAVPLEPARPFWVLDYPSPRNPRKDYEDSFEKYENHLKVPYYLVFHVETKELIIYRHSQRGYEKVVPNSDGRFEIAELDMEAAVLDGWARFWYQGNLLLMPAEMLSELEKTRRLLPQEAQRADRADEERQLLETERQHLEAETQYIEAETERIEAANRNLDEQIAAEKQRADELQRRLRDAERKLAALGRQTGDHPAS